MKQIYSMERMCILGVCGCCNVGAVWDVMCILLLYKMLSMYVSSIRPVICIGDQKKKVVLTRWLER